MPIGHNKLLCHIVFTVKCCFINQTQFIGPFISYTTIRKTIQSYQNILYCNYDGNNFLILYKIITVDTNKTDVTIFNAQ